MKLSVAMMLCSIGLLSAGCASVDGPAFSQLAEPPPSDRARVYFYRHGEEPWNIRGRKFQIYVNSQQVGVLPYGGYFSRTVASGETVFACDSSGSPLPVITYLIESAAKTPGRATDNLAGGSTAFVKLRVTDEGWSIKGALTVEPKDTAINEMKSTKLLE